MMRRCMLFTKGDEVILCTHTKFLSDYDDVFAYNMKLHREDHNPADDKGLYYETGTIVGLAGDIVEVTFDVTKVLSAIPIGWVYKVVARNSTVLYSTSATMIDVILKERDGNCYVEYEDLKRPKWESGRLRIGCYGDVPEEKSEPDDFITRSTMTIVNSIDAMVNIPMTEEMKETRRNYGEIGLKLLLQRMDNEQKKKEEDTDEYLQFLARNGDRYYSD